MSATTTTTVGEDLARIADVRLDLRPWITGVTWDQCPVLSPHAPDACEND